jgi:enterochelin esterase family protein
MRFASRPVVPFLILLAGAACGSGGALPIDAAPPDAPPAPFVLAPGTTTVLTKTLAVGAREIVLFVPAFAYDKGQAYFLLVNDGQDAGALGLAVTLDDLWKKGMLAPMVVVALPVTPGGDRVQDYGTAEHDVSIACDPGSGSPLLGTQAGAYARYLIDQALPAAAQEVGITPVAARTGLLGASLGGLSAFSIAWDHPEVFGFAGAMSGSFWWRTLSGTVEDRQASRIMPAIVARTSPRPAIRAWFEAGTDDETADRDGDGIIDAIDDTLDLMAAMQALGFQSGVDMVYDEKAHGIHGYATWSAMLPVFLTWAAGT